MHHNFTISDAKYCFLIISATAAPNPVLLLSFQYDLSMYTQQTLSSKMHWCKYFISLRRINIIKTLLQYYWWNCTKPHFQNIESTWKNSAVLDLLPRMMILLLRAGRRQLLILFTPLFLFTESSDPPVLMLMMSWLKWPPLLTITTWLINSLQPGNWEENEF